MGGAVSGNLTLGGGGSDIEAAIVVDHDGETPPCAMVEYLKEEGVTRST